MRSRGFTLVELLIWMGLSGLLLLVLVNLIIPALRLSARTQVRLELGRLAVRVAQQLQKDLEVSAPGAWRYADQTLVLQTVEGLSAEGGRLWSGEWALYHREAPARRLWRQLAPLSQATLAGPRLPSPAELATLLAASSPQRHVLALDLSDFSLVSLEDSEPAARLLLIFEAPVAGQKDPERLVWEQIVRWPGGDS